ncbi:YggT family protein [Brachybacterium sp. AOP25-B2-12]|uniref:YggT family protein n=1 Tax=Brachybacterium sp. AOP25-B2-12 TaxID=3457710 RepID=UPI0040344AEB
MQIVLGIAYLALLLYVIALLARLVLDWIRSYAREYRPRGIMAVVFEVVFTLTDPPVRALRRVIPPLRLGAVSLDLSLMILLLAGWLLLGLLGGFVVRFA